MAIDRAGAFRMASVVIALGLLTACGSSSGDAVETGGEATVVEAVPEDLLVDAVAVNDQEGWVVGQQPGQTGPAELWRLEPGEASPVGEVPELSARRFSGSEFGLTVVGLRCASGGTDDCEEHLAVALQIGHDGNTEREITLWEDEGAIGDGSAAGMIGEADGLTWLRIYPGLTSVGPEGDLNEVPNSDGMECIVDDRLYGIRSTEPSPQERSDELSTDAALGGSAEPETFEVVEYGDDDWSRVANGEHEFDGAVRPSASCVGDRIDVHDRSGNGPLLASWSPDAGWARVDLTENAVPEGTEPTDVSSAGRFMVAADGEVMEQAANGGFEPTGLELAAPPQGGLPQIPQVDASERLIVGCVSSRDSATVCDVSERD